MRPFERDDASSVQRLAGDQLVAQAATTIPHPYPDGAAEAWIATHEAGYAGGKEVTYAVVLRETSELVGTVSLLNISKGHARAELGYWTGVQYWGRGYCTEAVVRLMNFGREHLQVTKFVARCSAQNQASARVMEKSGLVKEGLLLKHVHRFGKYEDMLVYGAVLPERGE